MHLRERISTAIMTVTPKMREIKYRLTFCRSRMELTLKPFYVVFSHKFDILIHSLFISNGFSVEPVRNTRVIFGAP